MLNVIECTLFLYKDEMGNALWHLIKRESYPVEVADVRLLMTIFFSSNYTTVNLSTTIKYR